MAEETPMLGISHVAICVRNVDRALEFYRDLLGFRVVKDALQNTSSGGLPHLYRDRHAQRRVVHLQSGVGTGTPVLVMTEHPGDTVSGEPIMLDQVGISRMALSLGVSCEFGRVLSNGGLPLISPV